MPDEIFAGARLKIERAKHHINDLNRQVGHFFSSTFSLVIEDDPNTGQRSISKKANKPVPIEFGLIVGDALHNIRSALDLMTWEAIRPFSHDPEQVQFPIGRDRQHFLEQMIPRRHINRAPEEIVRAFRELAAYPSGDGDDFCTLHLLDIYDKHRVITPVAAPIVTVRGFSPKKIDPGFSGPTIIFLGDTRIQFNTTSDQLYIWHSVAPIAEVKRRFKRYKKFCSFTIAFGSEPGIVAGQLIIGTLKRLLTKTERAINSVEVAVRKS